MCVLQSINALVSPAMTAVAKAVAVSLSTPREVNAVAIAVIVSSLLWIAAAANSGLSATMRSRVRNCSSTSGVKVSRSDWIPAVIARSGVSLAGRFSTASAIAGSNGS